MWESSVYNGSYRILMLLSQCLKSRSGKELHDTIGLFILNTSAGTYSESVFKQISLDSLSYNKQRRNFKGIDCNKQTTPLITLLELKVDNFYRLEAHEESKNSELPIFRV